jgi:hypothetical protein
MKKSTMVTVLIISTLSLLSFSFISSQQALSHDGDKFWDFSNLTRPGVLPVNNANYDEECGSCHMAYSPGLLPKKSWMKVMGNLEEHYGDNAELLPQQHIEILNKVKLAKNSCTSSTISPQKGLASDKKKNKGPCPSSMAKTTNPLQTVNNKLKIKRKTIAPPAGL